MDTQSSKFKKIRLLGQKYQNILIYLSLPLQILVVQLISLYPSLVEKFYTGILYKKLSQFLRIIFGSVSVPIGQIIFYSLVTGLLVAIVKHIRKLVQKQIHWRAFIRTSLLGVVTFLSLFYFLFTGMWALNYHRQPIEEIAHIPEDSVSAKELETLCRRLIWLFWTD